MILHVRPVGLLTGKSVAEGVGLWSAPGACKKHKEPYDTATRDPLRGTPFLAAALQISYESRFLMFFSEKLRFFVFLKIYMDTPIRAAPGPTSGGTVYAYLS